ncbi:hypothetical protein HZB03_02270 [Candidatus Woesearchaeota archaeon]|nr:hypothetical protein [Candidatus Woesearchaeota archaeon]
MVAMVVGEEEQTNQASKDAPSSAGRRETAVHVRIAEVLAGVYTKREGWDPNTIDLGNFRFSRVNLLGVIISNSTAREGLASSVLMLDDGSGRIMLRSFDTRLISAAVGDLVLVVGRPREFNGERYVMPEIIRKLDNLKWIEVRKQELELLDGERLEKKSDRNSASGAIEQHESASDGGATIVVGEEATGSDASAQSANSNPAERVLDVIRAKDLGRGVAFEEISAACPKSDIDAVLRRLLESGEVFELRAGRYRVLE